MKNKEILEEGKEALNRTLLMMNYDMKKTLTENVEVISEQTTSEKDIKDEIIDATVRAFGTNTKDLRDVIKKITNKALYDKVNAELVADRVTKKYFPNDRTIVGILNDELGNGDLEIANEIASHLKTLGINVVVTPANVTDNAGRPIPSTTSVGKIAISTEPVTKNKTGYFTGVFSCIGKTSANQTEGTYQGQKVIRDTQPSSMTVYWEDGHWTRYAYNDKTKKTGGEVARGKFKCNGTKQTITTDTKKQSVPSITDKNLLSTLKFNFKYPGDNVYSYAFVPGTVAEAVSTQNGTWYAKNNKTGKVFDMSKHFPKTAEKLNTQFPNAGQKVIDTETDTETDTNIPEPQGAERPTPPSDENLAASQLPQNESLKKSLKNNLMEMKEKKENLMVESKIIRKRFEMITENRTFNSETDGDFIVESLFTEVSYLKRQGYDSKLINEGIFGWIGSLLGGTVTEVPDVIKEYISAWLLKTVGVSADSYLGNVLVTLIGDLSFSDYDKFFSDCKFASNKVADSLINGYLRKLQEENQSTSGAGGFVISAIRNSVVTYFADTKDSIIQKLEDEIINFLLKQKRKEPKQHH
jgi:hypothetical protein